MANENSTALELGDEPFQFYRKFGGVKIAVDEDRVHGIEALRKNFPDIEIILLDDAFQHRHVKAGFYILLTSYDEMYTDDLLLPAGNLREGKEGASRADAIVVTKCPKEMSEADKLYKIKKISPMPGQRVFFSTISYSRNVIGKNKQLSLKDLLEMKVVLVTGIANSRPMEEFLREQKIQFTPLRYGDHKFISDREIGKISKIFEGIEAKKKLILTTEKDYVRSFIDKTLPVYYLPIQSEIMDNGEKFNELIQDYVRKGKGNR